MSALALLLASQLGATSPDVTVVLSRREGVSKAQAHTITQTFIQVLTRAGLLVVPEAVDGLSCAGKKPCLVALGRKQHSVSVLAIEVATILDDGVIRAEGLSVDEDGKRVALTDYEGSLKKKDAIEEAAGKLVKGLKAAAAAVEAPTPVVEKPKPVEPVAVTPPPTPPPAPTPTPAPKVEVAAAPPPAVKPPPVAIAQPAPATTVSVTEPSSQAGKPLSTRSVTGITLLSVGAASVIVGSIFGVQALTEGQNVTTLCPGTQCNDPKAFASYETAARSQSLGLVFGIGGGIVAAAGLLLLLTGTPPADAPKVSVFVTPNGGAASMSLSW